MEALGRIEGLLLIGTGVLLALAFLALAFVTFWTLSVPNPKLLWVDAGVFVASAASLVLGFRLLVRPDATTMMVGGILLAMIAVATVTRRMGMWSV